MPGTLLETKFHIPVRRRGDISRQSLIDILERGLWENRKFTLVSAPAGYGKTTTLADWVETIKGKHRVSWLSLEEGDNEFSRFLQYWMSAFARLEPSLGQHTQQILIAAQAASPRTAIDMFINQLVSLGSSGVLILDDYHVITNPQVHEFIEYFIEHQPPDIHLAMTTREDPPFPLARLRTRRQMTEIRAQDLRFSLEEARRFLSESMKLQLDTESITRLAQRTEGWAAGLQLAAMALQNQPHPRSFIRTFSGSHRYILDYLAEAVLRQQDDETREFLLKTAILEKFNASLCNAVTERSDSSLFISRLEQANLFLIPLDDDRSWYRYHHLFAEYLQTRQASRELAALHQTASGWYEENGLVFEAIQHAFLSGREELAADVLERVIQNPSTWAEGNVGTLLGWLDKLPHALLHSRPILMLHASRAFYLVGRTRQAQQFLDQAERSLRDHPEWVQDVDRLLAITALYRGSLAAFQGNLQTAFDRAAYALDRLPREDQHARARAFYTMGLAYALSGRPEDAISGFLQSSDLALSAGVPYLAVTARCEAAMEQIVQGKLEAAAQTCREAIKLAGESPISPAGLAYAILGQIALERNDMVQAEQHLTKGMELSERGGLMDDVRCELLILARLKQVTGDWAAAIAAIDQADAITRSFEIPRLSMLIEAHRARLQLAQGMKRQAHKWADAYEEDRRRSDVEYIREFEDLTLARIYLANRAPDRAKGLLEHLLAEAERVGRGRTCIETMILLSLVYQAQNRLNEAAGQLEEALMRVEQQGFLRLFLDEGPSLQQLLIKIRPTLPDWLDPLPGGIPDAATDAPEILITPLSAQERKVLSLITAGKSNQEIAQELVISPGTAKWHVHNVLRKLGVRTRAQAIVRARTLGIE